MDNKRIDYLIRKLKEGKKKYFSEFYDKTKTMVYFAIKKVLKQGELVEDVMQDSYIKFLSVLSSIDEDKSPVSYLLTIARNKAIDYIKKNSKTYYTDEVEIFEKSDESFELRDMPLLSFCKENLTKDEYRILELTVVMGYRRVEVAKILGEPISTVNWKYNKILKKVKKLYKEVYQK